MGVLDLFKLNGKVAIVTGAGRGLGRAMAHGLAEAGANVVIADADEDNSRVVSGEIKAMGRKSMAIKVDIASPELVQDMAEEVNREFGRIDILVNNVGVAYKPQYEGGPRSIATELVNVENWESVIRVNLVGTFLCTQSVGKIMIGQGHGNIINIASMSAFVAISGHHNNAYSTSKSGIIMFTRQLAGEWADHGIRVNAIAPGYMSTRMGGKPLSDPKIIEHIRISTPMRRPADPGELKGLVVFLASDASSYITGQIILMDGGCTCW
jgi:NAD(P)-dependent dehydrogenase (short-subunit alcohol dehydrogenase family)